eukprot:m.539139 g.539139  ORF g.539139 m.539139 type:complete len:182 (-) comp22088_c0_seq9:1523-2068(-)
MGHCTGTPTLRRGVSNQGWAGESTHSHGANVCIPMHTMQSMFIRHTCQRSTPTGTERCIPGMQGVQNVQCTARDTAYLYIPTALRFECLAAMSMQERPSSHFVAASGELSSSVAVHKPLDVRSRHLHVCQVGGAIDDFTPHTVSPLNTSKLYSIVSKISHSKKGTFWCNQEHGCQGQPITL